MSEAKSGSKIIPHSASLHAGCRYAPMSLQLYLVFVLASALLVATPGPNVALVVGTSLRYGARTGLLTVGGVNFGLVLQLAAVAAGLSWIVELFARHFDVIR